MSIILSKISALKNESGYNDPTSQDESVLLFASRQRKPLKVSTKMQICAILYIELSNYNYMKKLRNEKNTVFR